MISNQVDEIAPPAPTLSCPWCGRLPPSSDLVDRLNRLAADAWPSLTPKEFEIALLAGVGLPSRLIARRLWLSARTVDNHLGRVYMKLRIDGRRALNQAVRPEPSLAARDTGERRRMG